MAQRERGAAAGARPAAHGARASAGRGRGRADTARTGSTEGRRPSVDLVAVRSRLRGIIEPAVIEAGLDLDDLVVSPAGRRLVVRVTVDGDDGVTHDELTEVSREISARLDEAEQAGGDLTPDSYTLEVSSPGVDRPLTLPRHWRRNIGRLIKAKAGERQLTGRVTAVDDEHGVTVDVDGRPVTVGFADLGPGRVQIEFTRLAEVELGDVIEDIEDDEDDDDLEDDDDDDDEDEADDDGLEDEDDLEDDDEDLSTQTHENGDSRDGRDGDTDLDLDEPQHKEDGA